MSRCIHVYGDFGEWVTKNKRPQLGQLISAKHCYIFRLPVRLVLKQSLDRLITTCVKVPDRRGILYISHPRLFILMRVNVCICVWLPPHRLLL